MKFLHIQARNAGGHRISGTLEAASAESVLQQLKTLHYTVISIEERSLPLLELLQQRLQIRREVLIFFFRQIGMAMKAGLPLHRTFSIILEGEANRRFRRVLEEINALIGKGHSLSTAFARFPWVFSKVTVNFIRAGEMGGFLPEVFDRLAWYEERELILRRQVAAAVAYPMLITTVMCLLLYFVFVWILPPLLDLYHDMRVPIPWLTQLFFGGITLATRGWFVALVVLLIVSAVWTYHSLLERSPAFAGWVDRWRLTAPILGGILRKVAITRFSRTVGTLFQQGIPILTCIQVAGEVCNNRHFTSELVEPLLNELKVGGRFSMVFHRHPLVPPMVASMILTGEETGELPLVFTRVADHYDGEIPYLLQELAATLQPILICAIGVLVTLGLLSTFLPIYRFIEGIF